MLQCWVCSYFGLTHTMVVCGKQFNKYSYTDFVAIHQPSIFRYYTKYILCLCTSSDSELQLVLLMVEFHTSPPSMKLLKLCEDATFSKGFSDLRLTLGHIVPTIADQPLARLRCHWTCWVTTSNKHFHSYIFCWSFIFIFLHFILLTCSKSITHPSSLQNEGSSCDLLVGCEWINWMDGCKKNRNVVIHHSDSSIPRYTLTSLRQSDILQLEHGRCLVFLLHSDCTDCFRFRCYLVP